MVAVATKDESARVVALHRYAVLDTPAEPEFDRITVLAARLFRVRGALLALVDADRQWLKSTYGLTPAEAQLYLGLAERTVRDRHLLVVEDAARDAIAADDRRLGRGGAPPPLRFFAGAPLRTAEGHEIGALAILDDGPRALDAAERDMLAHLAAMAMDELELRATARRMRHQAGLEIPVFRETDMRLEFIAHQFPAIVWTTDRELRITSGIGGGLARYNLAPHQLTGVPMAAFLGTDDPQHPTLVAHRRALEGAGGSYQQAFADHVYEGRVEPLRDAGGAVVGVIGVTMDVTERARWEAEARAMEARLQHADRLAALGTLAAGMAHEINNPLTYVINNIRLADEGLEALRRDAACDDLRAALAAAGEGAERVRRIVRDLRTYARADVPETGTVDAQRALEWALSVVGNEIRSRARLSRALAPTPLLRGTETRLGQVLVNLLVNAAQAIPEGHAGDNEIGVSSGTDEAGWAVIAVRDTGAGIAPDVARRLFEPFFTTKPKGAGLGLGLFVCHGIVAAMGGTLTAESAPGQGATFTVRLPPLAAASEAAASSGQGAGGAPAGGGGRRARVLIVDDEPQVLRTITRALDGHEVLTADGGREALDLLERDRSLDLLLCDLTMHDVSGIELYRRASARWPELAERFVFMTGGVFTDAARAFLDAVPNRCVEKPFDLRALRELVAERAGAAGR